MTFGIKEPFKQKLVLQRIDIGNSHTIRRQRTCGGPTPRPDRNAFVAGVFYEIPDDQKVSGKAHRLDSIYLNFEACSVFVERVDKSAVSQTRIPFFSFALLKTFF